MKELKGKELEERRKKERELLKLLDNKKIVEVKKNERS